MKSVIVPRGLNYLRLFTKGQPARGTALQRGQRRIDCASLVKLIIREASVFRIAALSVAPARRFNYPATMGN